MPQKVISIILDINKDLKEFRKYSFLTAKEKIERIVRKMDLACQELLKRRPKCLWLVAWRENGITAAGIGSSEQVEAVSEEIKEYMLDRLKKLANKYKDNLIIAAPLAVVYPISDHDFIAVTKQLTADYKNFASIGKQEEKDGVYVFSDNMRKIASATKKSYVVYSAIYFICHQALRFPLEPIGNFEIEGVSDLDSKESDEILVTEHRKFVPSSFDACCDNEIFQIAGRHTFNPSMKFYHAASKTVVSLRVFLCIESLVDLEEHNTWPLEAEYPFFNEEHDICVVFSDSIELFINKLKGLNIIHADSHWCPRHVVTKFETPKDMLIVEVYEVNVLSDHFVLRGPLQPVYPLDLTIKDSVELLHLKYKEAIRHFQRIKDNFVNGMDSLSRPKEAKDRLSVHPLAQLSLDLQGTASDSDLICDTLKMIDRKKPLYDSSGKITKSYYPQILDAILVQLQNDSRKVKEILLNLNHPFYRDIECLIPLFKKLIPSWISQNVFGSTATYLSQWAERTLMVAQKSLEDKSYEVLKSPTHSPLTQFYAKHPDVHPAAYFGDTSGFNTAEVHPASFVPYGVLKL